MTIWSLYIVTNKANGEQYVGMTKNLNRRWGQHQSANGSAPALHAAIKNYGADGFIFSHIWPESEKIKHASFVGRKHSEETKAKIRASNIATKALLKAKRLAGKGIENA